jgi:NADPH:quinone reductase-like Zn-dependent oxidoreductase
LVGELRCLSRPTNVVLVGTKNNGLGDASQAKVRHGGTPQQGDLGGPPDTTATVRDGTLSNHRKVEGQTTSFPLEQAAEAQRHQSEDRPFGKVVLTV